jgi:hypothetical protein
MAIDQQAILRRAAELTSRSEELLAEPRPEVTYQPPQPTRYRGYEVETMHDMLKASEARFDKRFDAIEARQSVRLDSIEARIQGMWQGVEGLADEAGATTGKLEKRINELQSQLNDVRAEISLLRALQPKKRMQPAHANDRRVAEPACQLMILFVSPLARTSRRRATLRNCGWQKAWLAPRMSFVRNMLHPSAKVIRGHMP